MWGRDLASFLLLDCPCTPGQVLLRQGLWTSSLSPWDPIQGQRCLMDEACLCLQHPLIHCCVRGHTDPYQHAHFIEADAEAPVEQRQAQVTWLPVLEAGLGPLGGQICSTGRHPHFETLSEQVDILSSCPPAPWVLRPRSSGAKRTVGKSPRDRGFVDTAFPG